MPFSFTALCTLLSSLEKIEVHDPPLLKKPKLESEEAAIRTWFLKHRAAIDDAATDRAALLSSLFPERRSDRVFLIQAPRLTRIVGRCLRLSAAKLADLEKWKQPGHGDLGMCVERILQDYDAEPRPGVVTVEEIDSALTELASRCRFSGPAVRQEISGDLPEKILGHIFLRLYSWEAKWLTRMILKDYAPVVLNEAMVFRNFHFLLAELLRFQNDFKAAVALLEGPLKDYPSKPEPQSEKILRKTASSSLVPQVGVRVGRPSFYKARSVDHCLNMVGNQRWSVERKYDGEYCEIHVDLAQADGRITIFSKSGRDSTEDRKAAHTTIRKSLRLGQPDCRFKERCIVLGELVVYSDKEQRILEFHKLRKHVSRSGSYLGTDLDSQRGAHEHLMIVFFDVLLVDQDIVMTKPYEDRRECLRNLVCKRKGYSMTSEWTILDFSEKGSKKALAKQFARSIMAQWEGLLLKPSEGPYLHFGRSEPGQLRGVFIKLKKDYINGLGDVADFAIVGACYEAKDALITECKGLQWTTFFIGCLENKEAVLRNHNARPTFRVIDTLGKRNCISNHDLRTLNELGKFQAQAFSCSSQPTQFDVFLDRTELPSMQVTFQNPFVCEVVGSGFDKPPNSDKFILRHPRMIKLHMDRGWKDTISLQELADLSEGARNLGKFESCGKHDEFVKRIVSKLTDAAPVQQPKNQERQQNGDQSPEQRGMSKQKRRKSGQQTQLSPTLVRVDTRDKLQGPFPVIVTQEEPSIVHPVSQNRLPTPASSEPKPGELTGNSEASKPLAEGSGNGSRKRPVMGHIDLEERQSKRRRCTALTLSSRTSTTSKPNAAHQRDVLQMTHTCEANPPCAGIAAPAKECQPAATDEHQPIRNEGSPINIPSHTVPEHDSQNGSEESSKPALQSATHRRNASAYGCICQVIKASVIYLWPSVAHNFPATTRFFARLGALQVSSLTHWCREYMPALACAENVPESQAYPGLLKIVIVDALQLHVSVNEVITLNIRDYVSFWDWRAVCHISSEGDAMDSECKLEHFFGWTDCDNESGKLIFRSASVG